MCFAWTVFFFTDRVRYGKNIAKIRYLSLTNIPFGSIIYCIFTEYQVVCVIFMHHSAFIRKGDFGFYPRSSYIWHIWF